MKVWAALGVCLAAMATLTACAGSTPNKTYSMKNDRIGLTDTPNTAVRTPSRWLTYDPEAKEAILTLTLSGTDPALALDDAPSKTHCLKTPPAWRLRIHANNLTPSPAYVTLRRDARSTPIYQSRTIAPQTSRTLLLKPQSPGTYQITWHHTGAGPSLACMSLKIVPKLTAPTFR